MIDKATIAEWRKEQGIGMTSALGDYTPPEFWELLDAYEAQEKRIAELDSGFWGRSCSRLQAKNNVMREHINNAIDLCQNKIQSSNRREAFAIDVQQELRAAAATKE